MRLYKYIKKILFLAFLTIQALLFFKTAIQAQQEIRFGVYNFTPLLFIDSEGAPQGLFMDVFNYIADSEKWKITIVPGTWNESLDRINRGEIDILPGVAYTEERSKYLDFSDEYLFLDWGMVYKKKGSRIYNIFDLNGKTISVLKGSIYTDEFKKLLNQFGIRARVIEKNEYRQVFNAIATGESDAGINAQLYGIHLEGMFNIEKTQIYFSPIKYRFAVKKDLHSDILVMMNSYLVSMKADSDSIYYSSIHKWVGAFQERNILPEWLKWVLGIAVCGVFMIVVFSIVMKKQVDIKTLELRSANEEMMVYRDHLEDLNRELKKIDRIKDEFLANTSHELKTPLNGIIGMAESLISGTMGHLREDTARTLGIIASTGRRLISLVNDILDFSRLKNKDLHLRLSPVDMGTIAEVVLTISQPLIINKKIELVNKISRDIAPVCADENRVEQILYNLIGNAIKFTDSGSVTVSAETRGDFLEISVTDTGIGIPEERQETIFASFEQADGPVEWEYGGTGLGLPISKQLVELHGGTLGVKSSQGKGACFYFTLPLSKKGEAGPVRTDIPGYIAEMSGKMTPILGITDRPVSEKTAGGRRHRIIAVDDDPLTLSVIANLLSMEHYEIAQAGSGDEALSLIARAREEGSPFHLVLLDIVMPRMSGYQVCRKLREKFPPETLPVIMLTGKNKVDDLVEGFKAGANDYITKPVSRDELLSRIKIHLMLMDIHEERVREIDEKNSLKGLLERELEFHREVSALKDRVIDRTITIKTLREMSCRLAINLTESRYCCITEILPGSGSQETHTVESLVAGDGSLAKENFTHELSLSDEKKFKGLWSPCLNTDKAFYTNSPGTYEPFQGADADKTGFSRIMSVPSYVSGECMGRIILADSSRDYTSSDLDHIDMLAALYGLVIFRIRNEG